VLVVAQMYGIARDLIVMQVAKWAMVKGGWYGLGRRMSAKEAGAQKVYNELTRLIGHFLLGCFVG